ncbi:MAG: dihydrolipoyl dehydrogenase [Deltaproteobacteria bacterium]|nr:dihydrolipoyl dehydrogenase [Deltaproteobacteria bacterium]
MYDVVVIGGGPGGYAAAIRASQLGGNVALVEAGQVGGTCVNRGCIPSKVWLRAAHLYRQVRTASRFGIQARLEGVDLAAVVARKEGVAGEIRMGMEALLKNNRIEHIRGRASLKSSQQVEVEGKVLEAKAVIVATGSVPEDFGAELGDGAALSTDEALDLTQLPPSLLVVGAGPIEVEFAASFQTLGCRVTLVTEGRRILPDEDGETGQRLAQALREQGVEILTGTGIASVEPAGSEFEASLSGAETRTVKVARVLSGSRRPCTRDLGLEQAGVALGEKGEVLVNDRLESSAKGIYAIGDATGGWMLSHAASAMGITAAENAMGGDSVFRPGLVPRGLWTSPQVGAVGLSEEEAEEKGYEVETGTFPYAVNGLAMAYGEVAGAVKIVKDQQYGEILGVHIVGAGATELIGEAVLAMELECTAEDLARTIRMHPTFSETMMDAGRDTEGWALYLPRR